MTAPVDTLAAGARAILGRTLTEKEREAFNKYRMLLQKWHKVQRLVSSDDAAWIVEHVFLDGLLYLKVLPNDAVTILDLGSGAGVPGIPMSIVRPQVNLTLVESRQRRASFLSVAIRELGLTNTRIVSARIEEVVGELAGRFDAVVMRCAGKFETLARLAIQLVVPGGLVIASGPPKESPLRFGEWVTVQGTSRNTSRRFAVYKRP